MKRALVLFVLVGCGGGGVDHAESARKDGAVSDTSLATLTDAQTDSFVHTDSAPVDAFAVTDAGPAQDTAPGVDVLAVDQRPADAFVKTDAYQPTWLNPFQWPASCAPNLVDGAVCSNGYACTWACAAGAPGSMSGSAMCLPFPTGYTTFSAAKEGEVCGTVTREYLASVDSTTVISTDMKYGVPCLNGARCTSAGGATVMRQPSGRAYRDTGGFVCRRYCREDSECAYQRTACDHTSGNVPCPSVNTPGGYYDTGIGLCPDPGRTIQ